MAKEKILPILVYYYVDGKFKRYQLVEKNTMQEVQCMVDAWNQDKDKRGTYKLIDDPDTVRALVYKEDSTETCLDSAKEIERDLSDLENSISDMRSVVGAFIEKAQKIVDENIHTKSENGGTNDGNP